MSNIYGKNFLMVFKSEIIRKKLPVLSKSWFFFFPFKIKKSNHKTKTDVFWRNEHNLHKSLRNRYNLLQRKYNREKKKSENEIILNVYKTNFHWDLSNFRTIRFLIL